MPEKLEAKQVRAGQAVLQVETAVFLTAEEAGLRLAATYPEQPMIRNTTALQQSMQTAARLSAIDTRGANQALAEEYAARISELGAKYTGDGRHVGLGSPEATHHRFDLHTFWTHREAAYALACVFGDEPPARLGWTVLHRGMQQAARAEVFRDGSLWTTSSPRSATVELFADKLVEAEVFAPDGGVSPKWEREKEQRLAKRRERDRRNKRKSS